MENVLKHPEVQEVVRLFGDLCRMGQRAASSSRRQAERYRELEKKNVRFRELLADQEIRAGVDALLAEARNLIGSEQDLIALRSQEAPQTTAFIEGEMMVSSWFPLKRVDLQKAVEISSKEGLKSRRRGTDHLAANPFPETSEELTKIVDSTVSASREQILKAKPLPRKAKKEQKKKVDKQFWGCTFGAGLALADVILAIQAVGLATPVATTSVTIGSSLFAKALGFRPKDIIPGFGASQKQAA